MGQVAIFSVEPEKLGTSEAPLAMVYESQTGSSPVVITIISLFAVVNGALIQIIMASRLLYGLSSQGWIPEVFSRIHRSRRTPWVSTLICTLAIWVLSFFSLVNLASATSFIVLGVFSLMNLSLYVLQRKEPCETDLPQWLPLIGFISSLLIILSRLLL